MENYPYNTRCSSCCATLTTEENSDSFACESCARLNLTDARRSRRCRRCSYDNRRDRQETLGPGRNRVVVAASAGMAGLALGVAGTLVAGSIALTGAVKPR